MPDPADPDRVDLKPSLSARREAVDPSLGPRWSGAPKAAARHFASLGSPGRIREASAPSDSMRRKVVVTAKKVPRSPTVRQVLTRHLSYLSREGVDQDGGSGRFFDRTRDDADAANFVERCQADTVHYRLIVNPEDGADLVDLKGYAREVMAGMEDDVGCRPDWIATCHFNTGRPHVHLVVRGRAEDGRSLRLTGRYLSTGVRARAEATATEILGPQIARSPKRVIQAERLTELDTVLIRSAVANGVEVDRLPPTHRRDLLRRLTWLEATGRATSPAPGRWTLRSDLRAHLLRVGQRDAGAIAAAKILKSSGWSDQLSRLVPISVAPGDRLMGAFVGVGRTGRFATGAQVIVLDLADGRLGQVLLEDAKTAMSVDRLPEGAVVQVVGLPRSARGADRILAEVAAHTGGTWSPAEHAAIRPKDWPRFVAFHLKRAEAMSLEGACSDLGQGRFAIPNDYVERARQADAGRWGPGETVLRVLDHRRLPEQVSAIGLTWLDRLMNDPPGLAGPFGKAVADALPERAKRLRMTGIGSGDPLRLSEADIRRLGTLDVQAVFETLEKNGKPCFLAGAGERVEGAYGGRVFMGGRPFAMIEGRHALHLTPWTPGLEACRGRSLAAVVTSGGIEFRTNRSFGLDLSR